MVWLRVYWNGRAGYNLREGRAGGVRARLLPQNERGIRWLRSRSPNMDFRHFLGAARQTAALSAAQPEQNVEGEGAPVASVRALQPLNGLPGFFCEILDAVARVVRVGFVIRHLALALEKRERRGERLYVLGEPADDVPVFASVSDESVFQRRVRLPPGASTPGRGRRARQSVGATVRQSVKQRVVGGADRAGEISLARPAPPTRPLRQVVRYVQQVFRPHDFPPLSTRPTRTFSSTNGWASSPRQTHPAPGL